MSWETKPHENAITGKHLKQFQKVTMKTKATHWDWEEGHWGLEKHRVTRSWNIMWTMTESYIVIFQLGSPVRATGRSMKVRICRLPIYQRVTWAPSPLRYLPRSAGYRRSEGTRELVTTQAVCDSFVFGFDSNTQVCLIVVIQNT